MPPELEVVAPRRKFPYSPVALASFSGGCERILGQEKWYSRAQTSTIVSVSGLQVVISMRPTSRTNSRPLFTQSALILSFVNHSQYTHSCPSAILDVASYMHKIRQISGGSPNTMKDLPFRERNFLDNWLSYRQTFLARRLPLGVSGARMQVVWRAQSGIDEKFRLWKP